MSAIKPWTYAGSNTKKNTVVIPSTWNELIYQVTIHNTDSISMVGYMIESMLSSAAQNGIYGAEACETTNGGKIAARVKISDTDIGIVCTHSGTEEQTSTSRIYVWYK